MLTAVSLSYTDNHETVKYGVLQIEVTSYHDNQQYFVTGCRYLMILYYVQRYWSSKGVWETEFIGDP